MKKKVWFITLIAIMLLANLSACGGEEETALEVEEVPAEQVPVQPSCQIAFTYGRDGDHDIYVMDADGSNVQQLTTNNSADVEPTWSPDGAQIAFASNRDGNWEIYVMDADGSNQQQLTFNSSNDGYPAWSPLCREEAPAEVAPTDISTPTPTNTPAYTPTVTSTDAGNYLISLWIDQRQNEIDSPELHWDVETVASLLGVDPPQDGYWSPVDIILEILKSDFGFDPNQHNPPVFYSVEIAAYMDGSIITGVVFSNPDGVATFNFENQYYHHTNNNVETGPNLELGIAPLVVQPPMMLNELAPGYYAARIRLTDDTFSNWVIFQVKEEVPAEQVPVQPSCQIAFHSGRDGDDEIYVMDADGSNVQQLTFNESDDVYPAWSPDGSRIAFHSDRDGDWEIYVMDADGSNVQQLTTNESDDWFPAWSPLCR